MEKPKSEETQSVPAAQETNSKSVAEELLKSKKVNLYRVCTKTHQKLAGRECASTATFIEAFRCNGYDFGKACIAAIATVGGKHAPIQEAMRFLKDYNPNADLPDIVPGWGSGFVKERPDPELDDLARQIEDIAPDLWHRIVEITSRLHMSHKYIYPNAACYTAGVALILNYPFETADFLLIHPRMTVWETMAQVIVRPNPLMS